MVRRREAQKEPHVGVQSHISECRVTVTWYQPPYLTILRCHATVTVWPQTYRIQLYDSSGWPRLTASLLKLILDSWTFLEIKIDHTLNIPTINGICHSSVSCSSVLASGHVISINSLFLTERCTSLAVAVLHKVLGYAEWHANLQTNGQSLGVTFSFILSSVQGWYAISVTEKKASYDC